MVMAVELLWRRRQALFLTDKQRKFERHNKGRLLKASGAGKRASGHLKAGVGQDELQLGGEGSLNEAFSFSGRLPMPLFKDKDVELIVDDAADMPPLYADLKKLSLVISNLLSNALRYTDAGGSVKISSENMGAVVSIDIVDTGIGIPESVQARVFERFFQMQGDEKHRAGGAGLGLALVKEIVEAMGGKVELKSKEGEGSKFSFTLNAIRSRTGSAERFHEEDTNCGRFAKYCCHGGPVP